jgi:hypothetical protein
MCGGEISDNTASFGGGGGVFINDGTFNMSGGKISGNTAYGNGNGNAGQGGGVYVAKVFFVGTFNMSGGEISGNTASYSGGGVCVSNGTFTKIGGGVIYGSDASDPLKNTIGSDIWGHAVLYYLIDSSASSLNHYYRDITLDTEDNISTMDTFPSSSGESLNGWTKLW